MTKTSLRDSSRSAAQRITGVVRSPSAPLVGLLAVGFVVRAVVLAIYTPSVLTFFGGDSTRYMRLGFTGYDGLFTDPAIPAGYPAFLQAVRAVTHWLPATVALQHLLGLMSGVLLFAATRRAGATRSAALAVASVVVLSGDQIFLEHAILTETLWFSIIAFSLYVVCGAMHDPVHRRRSLAVGGALLGATALIRTTSEILPVVVALWAAVAFGGSARVRLAASASVLVPALLVLGTYYVISVGVAGGSSGLIENAGFQLYGRTGQFADCSRFEAPGRMGLLCSSVPLDRREGPSWWQFNPASPLYGQFAFDPRSAADQRLLTRFSRRAILNQPLSYVRAVAFDLARLAAPDLGLVEASGRGELARAGSGATPSRMSFGSPGFIAQTVDARELAGQFSEKYSGVGDGASTTAARALLGAYQSVFRLNGLALVLLLVIASSGVAFGRGPTRSGCGLFLACSLSLFVLPVLVVSYDVRYSVHPGHLLAASAALGLSALRERKTTKADARHVTA